MNTSLIKTAKGLTITVKHAVSTPHPYDRINLIAGTKGFSRIIRRASISTAEQGRRVWGPSTHGRQYSHPLWQREGEIAQKVGGHGGMDYIMLYRLLQCVREGLPPDSDVYDCASWSAVAPLSVASVSGGSAPVEFPDFTRGKWKERAVSAIATQS